MAFDGYIIGPHALAQFATALVMLGLGLVVVARERTSRESVVFLGVAFLGAFALAASGLRNAAPDRAAALMWTFAVSIGVGLLPASIYEFTISFLRIGDRRRTVARIGWVIGASFVAVVLGTDRFIAGVRSYPWGWAPVYGSPVLATTYIAYMLGFILMSIAEYRRAYATADSQVTRARIRLVGLAFSLILLVAVDLLPILGVTVYPFGYVAVLAFTAVIAWTLRRHRLVELTPSFAAEQVLATMAEPVVVCDREGRIRVVNAAVEQVFGVSQEELIGRELEPMVGSDEAGEVLRRVRAQEVVRGVELRLRTRTGEPIDISVSASPLFDPDLGVVGIVVIARDIRERKQAEAALTREAETLRALSMIDELTGLYNRRGLLTIARQQLQAAERAGRSMVLLFADLDNMKQINDAFGHAAGDRALTEMAQLLRRTFRGSDVVGRIGGDEFVVLAVDSAAPRDQLLERVRRALEAYNRGSDLPYRISASFGLADFDPLHPVEAEALLAEADRRMYEDKRGKRSVSPLPENSVQE